MVKKIDYVTVPTEAQVFTFSTDTWGPGDGSKGGVVYITSLKADISINSYTPVLWISNMNMGGNFEISIYIVYRGYIPSSSPMYLSIKVFIDGTEVSVGSDRYLKTTQVSGRDGLFKRFMYTFAPGLHSVSVELEYIGNNSGVIFANSTNMVIRSVDSSGLPGTITPINIPGTATGRLTLSATLPVTTNDVTAATTLYYLPYNGDIVTVYSSGSWKDLSISGGISISLASISANTNYDVFVYDNADIATLELVAWTNATTRAVGLTWYEGVRLKSSNYSRMFLGTIRATATAGQCEDSIAKRFVCNAHNRVKRELRKVDTVVVSRYSGGGGGMGGPFNGEPAVYNVQFVQCDDFYPISGRTHMSLRGDGGGAHIINLNEDGAGTHSAGDRLSPHQLAGDGAYSNMWLDHTNYYIGYHILYYCGGFRYSPLNAWQFGGAWNPTGEPMEYRYKPGVLLTMLG